MATQTIVRHDSFYIGGEWTEPAGEETHDVINASTEELLATVPLGTPADVDRAVAAARAGFEEWSQADVPTRAEALAAIAAALEERGDEIAALISSELGMPLEQSRFIQAGLPAMSFGSMAKIVGQFPWQEELGNSLIVREPIGVVGAITPWNYPLHQVCAKVAPAIAAGCSIVVKPSEVTPLSAFVLAEIIDSVGLPAGVFNLVTGTGPVVGEAISAHPGVDMVSITGSTVAGKRVAAAAAETVKRVGLELGGKSANIILDDADLTAAVPHGIQKCMLNSGQTCVALTRMLVPREKLAEAEAIAKAAVENAKLGDPFDPETTLGPMVTEDHRERVLEYIRKGIDEGARLVTGGPEPVEGVERGWFVQPTVFSDVEPDMVDRAGGDLRPGAGDHPLRRRGAGDRDRERLDLRALRRGLVVGSRARPAGRPPAAHRPGRDQQRGVQPARAVRRLQAVGHGPRAGPARARRVHRDEGDAAVMRAPTAAGSPRVS